MKAMLVTLPEEAMDKLDKWKKENKIKNNSDALYEILMNLKVKKDG